MRFSFLFCCLRSDWLLIVQISLIVYSFFSLWLIVDCSIVHISPIVHLFFSLGLIGDCSTVPLFSLIVHLSSSFRCFESSHCSQDISDFTYSLFCIQYTGFVVLVCRLFRFVLIAVSATPQSSQFCLCRMTLEVFVSKLHPDKFLSLISQSLLYIYMVHAPRDIHNSI